MRRDFAVNDHELRDAPDLELFRQHLFDARTDRPSQEVMSCERAALALEGQTASDRRRVEDEARLANLKREESLHAIRQEALAENHQLLLRHSEIIALYNEQLHSQAQCRGYLLQEIASYRNYEALVHRLEGRSIDICRWYTSRLSSVL